MHNPKEAAVSEKSRGVLLALNVGALLPVIEVPLNPNEGLIAAQNVLEVSESLAAVLPSNVAEMFELYEFPLWAKEGKLAELDKLGAVEPNELVEPLAVVDDVDPNNKWLVPPHDREELLGNREAEGKELECKAENIEVPNTRGAEVATGPKLDACPKRDPVKAD